jgi:hypothetical protein
VEKTCHQHCDCLRKHTEEETVADVPEVTPMLLPPAELPRTQVIERTRHRYEDIHRRLDKRWTISAIARRLNLDRKTVRRFRDSDLDRLPAPARERRPNGVLEPFKAYLNARFTKAQGQVSGTRLFLEIQARGYRGSQVRLACRDITRACVLARAFADLVRHQRGYLLLEWIRQAEQDAPKPMKGFAGFLRQDLDAVTAGLTLPWSSGGVEEHVIG